MKHLFSALLALFGGTLALSLLVFILTGVDPLVDGDGGRWVAVIMATFFCLMIRSWWWMND